MTKAAIVTFSPPHSRSPREPLLNLQKRFFGKWANTFDTIYVADIGWHLTDLPPNARVLRAAHQYPEACLDYMVDQLVNSHDVILILQNTTIIYDHQLIDRAIKYTKKYDAIGVDGWHSHYLWLKAPIARALRRHYSFFEYDKMRRFIPTVKNLALKEDCSTVDMGDDFNTAVINSTVPKTGFYNMDDYYHGLNLAGAYFEDQFAYERWRQLSNTLDANRAAMWLDVLGYPMDWYAEIENIPTGAWQKYRTNLIRHHDWLKPKPQARKA